MSSLPAVRPTRGSPSEFTKGNGTADIAKWVRTEVVLDLRQSELDKVHQRTTSLEEVAARINE